MKKLCAILAIGSMAAVFLPACGSTAPDCTKPEVTCVGLVTDVGTIADESVNQYAWAGIQQARAQGLVNWIKYIETVSSKDYDANIATFGDAGYKIIVTAGSELTDATYAAALNYPDIKFIGVDQYLSKDGSHPDWPLTNLIGLTFPEDQAGFLVGALAAMMSRSHKIAVVGGSDVDPFVWRYSEGYKAGAAYADENRGTTTEVSAVFHTDVSLDKAFDDEAWGTSTADSLVGQGVDVLFGTGGRTSDGAVLEAAKLGILVIGAGADEYLTLPEAAPKIVSSAIKMESAGVFDLINLAHQGEFPSGNYAGKIGFAPYHDTGPVVPVDVNLEMMRINQDIQDGTLQTNVPPFKPQQ